MVALVNFINTDHFYQFISQMDQKAGLGVKKICKSFGFAAKGIVRLIQSEQNARTHLVATFVVIIFGVLFRINSHEWILVILAVALVWAAEAFNTAIERLVDMISPEKRPQAGLIKDIAAGGVLFCSIAAFLVGVLIFLPKIIRFFCT